MKRHLIAPSVLSADFSQLKESINLINQSEADWLHVDVMDGNFVPNISFGQVLMPFFKDNSDLPLDVHLMIERPERYVEQFVDLGAEVVTVHYEASVHLHRTLQMIKNRGAKAGVAINPHTSFHLLEDVLEMVDLILVMSVNPGFGGQKFIYNAISKIQNLREMCIVKNLNPYIQVDGGVGLQNAQKILQAGADVLVAGNAIFGNESPSKIISELKNISANLQF